MEINRSGKDSLGSDVWLFVGSNCSHYVAYSQIASIEIGSLHYLRMDR